MTVSDEELIADLKEDFDRSYYFGQLSAPQTDGLLFIARKGKDYWNAWRRTYRSAHIALSGLNQQKLRNIDFSGFEFPTIEGKFCVDFSRSKFSKENRFIGAIFGETAIFENSHFDSANFQNTIFGDNAKFGGAQFFDRTNFQNATFADSANFTATKFGGPADLSGCNFGKHLSLENAHFSGEVIFINAIFGTSCRFSGTRFSEPAEFKGSTFGDDLQFSPAHDNAHISFNCLNHDRQIIFQGISNFSGNDFRGGIDFGGCIFSGTTRLSTREFGTQAKFEQAEFHGAVVFNNVQFGRIEFIDTTFHEDLTFEYTRFEDEAKFLRVVFCGSLKFKGYAREKGSLPSFHEIRFFGCWLAKGAVFRGHEFKTTALFGKTPPGQGRDLKEVGRLLGIRTKRHHAGKNVFLGIPDFHGCKFHQDTSFVGTEFEVPPGNDAARAFRTLKLAMEQLKSTHEEQKFFRLEMEADRTTLPGLRPWISKIYQITSDYGFSLWRPIACLILLSTIFGMAYGWLANTCAADGECAKTAWAADTGSAADRTSAVIKYTLASVSPVPGLDKMQTELRAPLFGHHGWVPITALVLEILHKIVALVMAFLFALALRNLFKMKS
jgi:uncharacterized protein YjbI with pentapeptide repeats